MKKETGWFRTYRSAFSEHDRFWGEKRERTKWEAWMDLINMASYADHELLYDGSLITVERGQVPTSERRLAERWSWSRGKVRRFLTTLEGCSRIFRKPAHISAHGLTLVTICNYNAFQGANEVERPTVEPTESPRKAQTEEGKEWKEDSGGQKKLRSHLLPDDWQPTDSHQAKATSERVDLAREAERFRNHHGSRGTRFVDWHKAFHNWLLKAGEFARRDGREQHREATPFGSGAARIVR